MFPIVLEYFPEQLYRFPPVGCERWVERGFKGEIWRFLVNTVTQTTATSTGKKASPDRRGMVVGGLAVEGGGVKGKCSRFFVNNLKMASYTGKNLYILF